jgi:hypothetical protein
LQSLIAAAATVAFNATLPQNDTYQEIIVSLDGLQRPADLAGRLPFPGHAPASGSLFMDAPTCLFLQLSIRAAVAQEGAAFYSNFRPYFITEGGEEWQLDNVDLWVNSLDNPNLLNNMALGPYSLPAGRFSLRVHPGDNEGGLMYIDIAARVTTLKSL